MNPITVVIVSSVVLKSIFFLTSPEWRRHASALEERDNIRERGNTSRLSIKINQWKRNKKTG